MGEAVLIDQQGVLEAGVTTLRRVSAAQYPPEHRRDVVYTPIWHIPPTSRALPSPAHFTSRSVRACRYPPRFLKI